MKTCSVCNNELPLEFFNKTGRQCKPCIRIKVKEHYKNNPEAAQKRRDAVNKWRLDHPEAYYKRQRHHHLKRNWGMSLDEYNKMLKKQNGVCAICGNPEQDRRGNTIMPLALAVDHDHETNKIRELLCMDCNQTLGKFNDDPNRFIACANYLIKHGKVLSI